MNAQLTWGAFRHYCCSAPSTMLFSCRLKIIPASLQTRYSSLHFTVAGSTAMYIWVVDHQSSGESWNSRWCNGVISQFSKTDLKTQQQQNRPWVNGSFSLPQLCHFIPCKNDAFLSVSCCCSASSPWCAIKGESNSKACQTQRLRVWKRLWMRTCGLTQVVAEKVFCPTLFVALETSQRAVRCHITR